MKRLSGQRCRRAGTITPDPLINAGYLASADMASADIDKKTR